MSIFPTSSSWSPKKEKLGWNLPVEFAYGAGYNPCELRFSYFDGHSIQQGQQKDMRIKPLASLSVLPGGFQPWTWLLGLGLTWMRALGWHKQYSHQGRLGQEWSEEWQVANECWKFWWCKMWKKYQVTKKQTDKKEISDKQRSKKLMSWMLNLGENHSNNPHPSIRPFLGEKNQTEMESEPSNCIFYLLFSFLFIKEKGPKSNNNLFCLILQNTLPSQIHENKIPFSPTVLYQLFCLCYKRGLNAITYRCTWEVLRLRTWNFLWSRLQGAAGAVTTSPVSKTACSSSHWIALVGPWLHQDHRCYTKRCWWCSTWLKDGASSP